VNIPRGEKVAEKNPSRKKVTVEGKNPRNLYNKKMESIVIENSQGPNLQVPPYGMGEHLSHTTIAF